MLSRIFDVDNVVFRTIDKIGKIIILNLFWIVFSLPVVTMGASTTALLYSSMKVQTGEGYWYENFWKSFKENFKQATAIFLLYALLGAFLAMDFMMGGQTKGHFGLVMQGIAGIVFVPYFLSLLYVFGVQSRFVNTVKDTIRYAFFMSLKNLKYTIQMAILFIFFVWINTTVVFFNFLTLIFGFGLMGYFFASYYRKIFEKYLETDKKEKKNG
ncbi:MAG: DUF624 domain-containing protein [Roseburia sp.]|nr:DUF624 domain-containing protein [Roseburia sp.]